MSGSDPSRYFMLVAFFYFFLCSSLYAAQPPSISFYWSPSNIVEGESTHRVWSAKNADSCVGRDGKTSIGVSGTSRHKPQYENMSVTITCFGPGGTEKKTAKLTVKSATPPSVSVWWSPSTITLGESTRVNHTSSNATSCVGTKGNSVPLNKTGPLMTQKTSKTVTITCTGPGGSVSRSASLTVNPHPNQPPKIQTITDQRIQEGRFINITPLVSDPDGDRLKFSITNKPHWAQFDSNNGSLQGRPSYTDAGVYDGIRIIARDGSSSDREGYSITVENVLDKAALQAPVDNAIVFGESLCFSWGAAEGAELYTIQISSSPSFNETDKRWVYRDLSDNQGCWNSQFIPNSNATNSPEQLTNGVYYWRIKSLDAQTALPHAAEFSNYRKFIVNRSAPNAPNGPEVSKVGALMNLTWDKVEGASLYRLFENDEILIESADRSYEFTPNEQGLFTYHIQACHLDSCTTNSATLEVNVRSASTVRGYIQGISQVGDQLYLQGWACQKRDNRSINVHIWAGGAADSGHFIASGIANEDSNSSIATECENSGTKHRFNLLLPKVARAKHGGQVLFVHGISIIGTQHLLLGRSGELKLPEYIQPLPEVIKFEWADESAVVGQPVELRIDVSNVESCGIQTGEQSSGKIFNASETLEPIVFFNSGIQVIKLYCTDFLGNRFPRSSNDDIELSLEVKVLPAPHNFNAVGQH